MSDPQPCLAIDYSPEFCLSIRLLSVDHIKGAGHQFSFDVVCKVLHFAGQFEYSGRVSCFDAQSFHDFVGQLAAIREGKAKRAGLHGFGDKIIFFVEIRGRDAKACVSIREHQPYGEQTLLSASFRVDYDSFVNALFRRALDFSRELSNLE